MTSQQFKCEAFVALHQRPGAFLIPNPWDLGSAKVLQGLGYQALATTSAGLAYTLGRADGEVTLDEILHHCSALAAHIRIPINADFENGFADDPDADAGNVLLAAGTGIAGCSIEDLNAERRKIYDFTLSVERIAAAVEAVATLDMPFMLTARAENLLHGVDDIEDTIRRLQAFEQAGANVLYAPGITSLDQLRQVTAELHTPFNVLAPLIRGASVDDFATAGAKRVSIGGALNWAAVNPVLTAAQEMLEHGTFNWTAGMARAAQVNKLLNPAT